MNDKKLLRKYVKTLLEAAVVGTAAASQGLALFRSQNAGKVEYILYDGEAFLFETKDLPADELVFTSIDPGEIIYGYLVVSPHQGECWDAAEVKYAAARKGFGPLMYEMALADFGSIMSDHGVGSSNAARNVWKKFSNRSDIIAKPFDDIKEPHTPPKEDDCRLIPDWDGENDYLNAAYSGSGDSSGKQAMMKEHERVVQKMLATKKDIKQKDVEQAIRILGDDYFSLRYREEA